MHEYMNVYIIVFIPPPPKKNHLCVCMCVCVCVCVCACVVHVCVCARACETNLNVCVCVYVHVCVCACVCACRCMFVWSVRARVCVQPEIHVYYLWCNIHALSCVYVCVLARAREYHIELKIYRCWNMRSYYIARKLCCES